MTVDIAKARALVNRLRDETGEVEVEMVEAADLIAALLDEVERLNSPVVLSEWQRLVAERDALAREVDACAAALPGPYYMDPPDGGDVPISEQVKRMARDAAYWKEEARRYCANSDFWRERATSFAEKGASDES